MEPSTRRALRLLPLLALVPAAVGLSGGDDGPFSTYGNPALPGAPLSLAPDGVQNYGETLVDALPLVDWDRLPVTPPDPVDCDLPSPIEQLFAPWLPDDHGLWLGSVLVKDDGQGGVIENPFQSPADFAAALRTPWHVPSADGTTTYEVRVRSLSLPSGVQALVLAPGTGDLQDFTVGAHSPCAGVDVDVLYWIPGTHGDAYVQNPLPWFEVEDAYTAPLVTGDLGRESSWFRDGSVAREALAHGMIVVVPEWNVGKRPLLWSLAQLIELDRHLTSAQFLNAYTRSPTGAPLVARNFITGGSYGGCVALWGALHLDWLFRGAIVRDCNPDLRQLFAFQEAYDFLRGQLVDNYLYDELTLTRDPYMNTLIGELERGFGGPPGTGTGGPPVDLAGLSLLSTDQGASGYANLLGRLRVPLFVVTGDEDYGMYTFFERDLAAANPLVVEKKVPARGHSDVGLFEVWNQTEGLLGQLLARPEVTACSPPPSSPTEVDWSVGRANGASYHDETFYADLLEPDRSPPVSNTPGFTVQRVRGGGWDELEVREGLGASGRVVIDDVDGDGLVEVYAGTARGDLVGLRLPADAGGAASAPTELFRLPVSSKYGAAEVVRIPGTRELLVLPPFGPLLRVALSTTGTFASLTGSLAGTVLGRGLRSLRERAPGRWVLWNDQGELLEVQVGGAGLTLLSRTYVEGGPGFVLPTTSSEAVYSSGHGFLKRYDFNAPGHPTSLAAYGTYLRGLAGSLEPLPSTGPAGAEWIGVVQSPTWRVALFDAQLREVGVLLECSGSPPRHLRVLSSSPSTVEYLTSWDVLPAAADVDLPGLVAVLESGPPSLQHEAGAGSPAPPAPQTKSFRTRLRERLRLLRRLLRSREDRFAGAVAATHASKLGRPPQNSTVPGLGAPLPSPGCALTDVPQHSLVLGAPISALERAPSGPSGAGLLGRDAAGQSFAVEWIALLHSGQVALVGDVTRAPIQAQVLGRATGSAFGLARVGPNLVAVGSEGRAWAIDGSTGAVLQALPNDTGAELESPEWGRRAHLGLGLVGSCVLGLYDGGDLLRAGAGGLTPLLAIPAAEVDDADPHRSWGGVKVLAVDPVSCAWDYSDPVPLFRSDPLFAPSATARPGPRFGAEVGNAVRWADVDADGAPDVVVATHGGLVAWYRNTSSGLGGFAADPAPTGVSADLGARLLGLEVADLDGDGDLELLVGTEADRNDTLPVPQLTTRGSIRVFDEVGGALVEVLRENAGFGVYGLRLLRDPVGDGRDLLLAGSAGGRFRLYELQAPPLAPLALVPRYESGFVAPHLGAFNAIQALPRTASTTRVVLGSSGGLVAFDLAPVPAPAD